MSSKKGEVSLVRNEDGYARVLGATMDHNGKVGPRRLVCQMFVKVLSKAPPHLQTALEARVR